MEVNGVVLEILDLETGVSKKTGNEWSKQVFVVETNDKFPKKVAITAFGKAMDDLDNVNVGDYVEAFINLESREFNGKWYHNINAWKIVVEVATGRPDDSVSGEDLDDLPF
jgi:hypothetical protein